MRWVSPAGEVLLLILPRRSTQEESAPAASPGFRRVLCAAQPQREGCGTRGDAPQTVLALFPVASCAARRRKGQDENQPDINRQPLRFRSVCFSSPSWSAEQRSAAGSSRRGLSEGEARVPPRRKYPWGAQPPGRTSSAGQPAKPAAQRGGRLLFGDFFLATQEKVTRRQGGTQPQLSEGASC